MSDIVYDVEEGIQRGIHSQRLFVETWNLNFPASKLINLDGRGSDAYFEDNPDWKVEIKTDRYWHTGNFFIEQNSNKWRKTLGGPFKAQKDGSKFYIYSFPFSLNFYMFITEDLCNFDYSKYGLIDVKNYTHTTTGYKVPIKNLIHLCKMKNIFTIDKFNYKESMNPSAGTD